MKTPASDKNETLKGREKSLKSVFGDGGYPNDILPIVGKNIAHRRKELKLSQLELAVCMGVSKSYVCDIEHGRRNFSMKMFFRLCKYLSIPASELIDSRLFDEE